MGHACVVSYCGRCDGLAVGAGPDLISRAFADDASACAQGAAEPAIVACTNVIASGRWRGRDLVWAYGSRGNAHNAKGDSDRAIADFDEAIQLDPELAMSYYNRGTPIAPRATAIAQSSTMARPSASIRNTRSPTTIGAALIMQGRRRRAIADYGAAIRLDPKSAAVYNSLGVAHYDKGDNDRAIADYDEVIRLDPDALTYSNRSTVYRDKGDNDRAIADCDEAIRLDPKFSVAYINRGNAYRDKGDDDRAIADCDEAIRLNPKDAVAYDNRVSRTMTSATTTAPSPTMTKRSASIRKTRSPTKTGATPITPRGTTTALSPTMTWRSALIEAFRWVRTETREAPAKP